jgi:nucleotide-binding universal stress UspA family protein
LRHHLLVPVDLFDRQTCEKAIDEAKHIARRDAAKLSVITVVPSWPEDLRRTPNDYKPDFQAYLDKIREDLDVEGIFEVGGSISGRITEAVRARDIDLVVMSSHNPRLTDHFIGSNAAHVVLHAPCSVMVVR